MPAESFRYLIDCLKAPWQQTTVWWGHFALIFQPNYPSRPQIWIHNLLLTETIFNLFQWALHSHHTAYELIVSHLEITWPPGSMKNGMNPAQSWSKRGDFDCSVSDTQSDVRPVQREFVRWIRPLSYHRYLPSLENNIRNQHWHFTDSCFVHAATLHCFSPDRGSSFENAV